MKAFISYAFADRHLMNILRKALRGGGIDTYIADHFPEYGRPLSAKIQRAIDDSDIIVAIVTKREPSPSVNQEVGYGLKAGKTVIPFVEEGAKVGFMIGHVEHVKFTSANMQVACQKLVGYLSSSRQHRLPMRPVKQMEEKSWQNSDPQRKANDIREMVVYCERCGELAGSRSECTGLHTSHNFTRGSGVIYCSRCGVTVGRKSECTGLQTAHEFVSGDGSEFCSRCGARIGKRSECIGLYTEHDFRSS